MKNFIEELRWRGMLQDSTPGVEEHLASGQRKGYIGFDPTGPSLTIGNYVQIMLLTFFQRSGHAPVALIGGATGRIGDPSGKDKERELLDFAVLANNVEKQSKQIQKFLDFESEVNGATLIDNIEFYQDMTVLEFLRDVGKYLTVNYMMSKDSVKTRLETGISFTEFSYQLIQGNDFRELYRDYGVTLQMGGSDQWGNITAGTELIRRSLDKAEPFAVTTPLLTKSDGRKFGKSEEGNIYLDPEMTTPYQFYQFWINADDRDIPKYFRYFSLRSREEIEGLEQDHSNDPRMLKQLLAEEITARVHSEEDVNNVKNVTALLFNKHAGKDQLFALSEREMAMIGGEITQYDITKGTLEGGAPILEMLAGLTSICQSKGEARRAITSNAISVNKEKITDIEATLGTDDLIHGKYLMLENGKKNKFLVRVV